MCVMSCTSQSYNQMSNFEVMATGIILLPFLLLLVPKGYCIETFGLAGQHVMPSDISGRLFSLDYIETIKYIIAYIQLNMNIESSYCSLEKTFD